MFQGQRIHPNTNFEFVNYGADTRKAGSGIFKQSKKPKLSIPNTMKFHISAPHPANEFSVSEIPIREDRDTPNISVLTFIADAVTPSPKSIRKTSYTITRFEQRLKLAELISANEIYKAKPKAIAWNKVVTSYNVHYSLDESEGLTVQHARMKLNQMISVARKKQSYGEKLEEGEKIILKYVNDQKAYNEENSTHDYRNATGGGKFTKSEHRKTRSSKIYYLIIKLERQLEAVRDLLNKDSRTDSVSKKQEFWLIHKKVLDLKTREEQYQILEHVNSTKSGARVKVSKEMREGLYNQVRELDVVLQRLVEVSGLSGDTEKLLGSSKVQDVVVDTQLLEKK